MSDNRKSTANYACAVATNQKFQTQKSIAAADDVEEALSKVKEHMDVLVHSNHHQPTLGEILKAASQRRLAMFLISVGLILSTVSIVLSFVQEGEWEITYKKEILRQAQPFADRLKLQVQTTVSAAYAMGANVGASVDMENALYMPGADSSPAFDKVAQTLIDTYGGISNLQLARCGVVKRIHPIAGNEAAIGHKLLQDADRVEGALAAITDKKLTFVGPLTLKQGGFAVIGRYPVFSDVDNSECIPEYHGVSGIPANFWGYSTVLTLIDDMLRPLKLGDLKTVYGLDYKITAPWGGKDAFVDGNENLPEPYETITIEMQDSDGSFSFASWSMHIRPVDGWLAHSPTFLFKIGLVAVSLFMALFSWFNVQAGRSRLEALVEGQMMLKDDIEAGMQKNNGRRSQQGGIQLPVDGECRA